MLLNHHVKRVCNHIGEVSDALCPTINFTNFHCGHFNLQRVDGGCLLVVGSKEVVEECKVGVVGFGCAVF